MAVTMKQIPARWQLVAFLTAFPIGTGVLLWSQVGPGSLFDPPLRLVVDLSSRTLKVIEHGELVRTYDVAVGRPRYPTPTGSFRTGTIDWNPKWVPPPSDWARKLKPREPGDPRNPMRGVKIYFKAPYYYIHGTNDPESIGRAASHGCIRMTEEDAVSLAERIERVGGGVPLHIRH